LRINFDDPGIAAMRARVLLLLPDGPVYPIVRARSRQKTFSLHVSREVHKEKKSITFSFIKVLPIYVLIMATFSFSYTNLKPEPFTKYSEGASVDLLTYQRTSEQELEHSANLAYARGDVDGAIGYVLALSKLLSIKLPQRPMRSRSISINTRIATKYYFHCLSLMGAQRADDITRVRAKYGRPFQIKTREAPAT
jgi:hypothetical protein